MAQINIPQGKRELIERFYPKGDLKKLLADVGYKHIGTLHCYASLLGVRRDKTVRYDDIARKRMEAVRKERIRQKWGLPQKTSLHLPLRPYTRPELNCRYNLKRRGYILGDPENQGERRVVYYNDDTKRSRRAERNAEKMGFGFKEED